MCRARWNQQSRQSIWGFPGGSVVNTPPANAGDAGLIPGSGRSPGVGNGNLLQYSYLRESHGQRSLAGYSPRGHTESGTPGHLIADSRLYQHPSLPTCHSAHIATICVTPGKGGGSFESFCPTVVRRLVTREWAIWTFYVFRVSHSKCVLLHGFYSALWSGLVSLGHVCPL